MRQPKTITLDDILPLFKKYLGFEVRRTGAYHYLRRPDFPSNTGWGRPRRWEERAVHGWFKTQLNKKRR